MQTNHLPALVLAGLTLAFPLGAQALDYANLVSLWRLNGNAADNYGTHDATFVGPAAYVAGPRPDTQAASLEGTSGSYLKAGQEIAFDTGTPFSATAWIKGGTQDAAIVGRMRHGGTYTGWALHAGTSLNPNGPDRLNVWLIEAFGSSYIQVNSGVVVLDDAWHHVAFTYDGSGVAAGVRIYVDGVDATGDASADGLGGSIVPENAELNLGTRMNGAGHNFRGALHEVSVWQVALTAADVAEIAAQGIRPPVLISAFTASAREVFAGIPTTLTWEVEPGAEVSIDQGVGNVTAQTTNGKGSVPVSVEVATTYTLTATKAGRTETKQTTVAILPLITSFTADRVQVPEGLAVQFSWVVHPQAAVSLAPGPGDVSGNTVQGVGSVSVTPGQSGTFTLKAVRGASSLEAQQPITVIEATALDYAKLVSLWRLDGNTVDNYGPNNGVFVGTATYADGPQAGLKAAVFDGASYIKTGQGVAFDTGTPFSATAWVKGPLGQDSTLFGRMRQGGAYTGWELHVGTGAGGSGAGRLNVWLINSYGSSFIQVNSPNVVLDDAWHHVAFTYDGSSTAAGVKIYVDGTDATGEAAADSLTDTILADDAELDLGTRQNGANHNFRGSLAEVSVWSAALDAGHIAYLYANGIRPPVLIDAFVAEPSAVFAGTPATLSWEVEPGTTLTIDQGVGDVTGATVDGKGSKAVSPETETTYILTATKGARVEQKTVTVGIRPLIDRFQATRTQIPRGAKAGLSWVVHPQAQITILPQPGNVTGQTVNGVGSVEVMPTETTTYTLTAQRGGSSLEAQVEVLVVDAPPTQAPDLPKLVSLWQLDGDTADALSANPGVFAPAAHYGPGPDLGQQAAVFDGASYVAAGQGISFDAADAFSATAWLKGPSGQNSTVVGRMRQGGAYTGWELHVGHSGAGLLNVWIINSYGSSFIEVSSSMPVLDDTWHHVAFTYDGSSTAAGVRLYVDGADTTDAVAADSLAGTILPPEVQFNLGSRQNGANHNLRGSLADVTVWSAALSPENVADLYVHGPRVQSVRLSGARLVPPAGFGFDWDSVVGGSYRIEGSTDLHTWSVVAESYPAGGATGTTTTFTETAAGTGYRFYRVFAKP